mmetsp:Transcript_15844/g.23854  ORF Transcript_15844/g.23854 Transcript_15844/m.23854 type:complete len:438 (+) Transcript_15844:133-1446(+)
MEGRQLWLPYFDRKSTFTFIVLNVALICVYMFGYLPNQQERDMPSMSRGTATVTLNKATVSRPHPFIVRTPDKRTEAVAAKFRSLSSRTLDMWWDDGADGVPQGRLLPGQESTTNSYNGHVFYFTVRGNKSDEVARVHIQSDQVLYPVWDPLFPAPEDVLKQTQREEDYSSKYLEKTGRRWRHYFGPDGPRSPPVLNMWPCEVVGQVHGVSSHQGTWQCDGESWECQSNATMELDLECVSSAPRVFVVESFLSDFEAETIVRLAQSKVRESTVGSPDGGGVISSSTRTSKNAWVPRHSSPITDTISRRVADVLGLDEKILTTSHNAEDMQVVHYTGRQKYDAHHDWGVSGYPESRFITVLLYLTSQSHPGAGGETAFPKGDDGKGGFKVRPVKGTAVIFYNLLEDGNGDDLALHTALPVTDGEKWLANFWIWDPKKK